MRDQQEEDELRARTASAVGQFADVDFALLIHSELKSGSLEPVESHLRIIAHVIDSLKGIDLSNVAFNRLALAWNKIDQAITLFRECHQYDVERYKDRDTILHRARQLADECYNEITPIAAFYRSTEGTADIKRSYQAFLTDATASVARLHAAERDATKNSEDALKLIESTRQQLQEVGVSRYAKVFGDEADAHDSSATKWLRVAIGLATLAGGAATLNVLYYIGVFTQNPPAFTAPQVVPLSIAKVLVFSGLFAATIWAGRVYRAHRHNSVVNRHRQNALSTFETFVTSASDQQTKNAVLLQATQSIFAPQQTGYMTTETDSGSGGLQVMKVFETIVGESKGKP